MALFDALNISCLAAFGSPVSYQQGTDAPFPILGIVQKDSDEERRLDGLYARLFVRLADLPSPPSQGDSVTISGVAYTVFEVLVDPTGAVRLRLRGVD